MWNNKLPNNFKSSFWVYGFCAKFHLANINNTNNLNPGGAAQQLCPKPQDWYIQRRSFSEIPIPKWITKTRRITKMKNIAGKKIWEHLFKPDAVKVGIWKCKKKSCWIFFVRNWNKSYKRITIPHWFLTKLQFRIKTRRFMKLKKTQWKTLWEAIN